VYRAVVGARGARRQRIAGSLAKYMPNAAHARCSIAQRWANVQHSHGATSVSRASAWCDARFGTRRSVRRWRPRRGCRSPNCS